MIIMMVVACVVLMLCAGGGYWYWSTTQVSSPAPSPGSAPGPRSPFPQAVTLTDPSFEAYSTGIAANGYWGGKSLGPGQPTYTAGAWSSSATGQALFNLKNDPWGGSDAADQSVYAVFQGAASIQQSVTVVPGGVYTVSWKERGRPGSSDKNDLNVSLNGTSVYTEANITGDWVSKTSSAWTAPAGVTTAILKFYATNPLGGDHSVFIDNISMTRTA